MHRTIAARLSAVVALTLSGGCQAVVYESLPVAEADRVVDLLGSHGIDAAMSRTAAADAGAYSVAVAIGDVGAAVEALLQVPAGAMTPQPGLQEVYDTGSIVPTPRQERARAAAAVGGELAATLERMPGVAAARVHVSPRPTPSDLDDATEARTAAVWVQLTASKAAGDLTDARLARLVSAAVPGLAASGVTVERSTASTTPPIPAPRWVRVGPWRVAAEGADRLRLLLAGSLLINALLAAGLALLWRRLRVAALRPG